jgi:hypothetical protein
MPALLNPGLTTAAKPRWRCTAALSAAESNILMVRMLLLPLQKYVQTPNLAEYLGLRPVDALHMSVPINAIFIGFKGDGNSKVRR